MFRLICLAIGYAIGCLQTAFIVGKLMGKIDIRDFGSGNAGTTNVTRVLGAKAGAIVFERFNQLQVGKGYALDYLLGKIEENYSNIKKQKNLLDFNDLEDKMLELLKNQQICDDLKLNYNFIK